MTDIKKLVGDRIRHLRTSNDLKQQELGNALGVSASAIGMYEQGRRSLDSEMLLKISDYFNVSSDYILCRTDNPRGMILTNKDLPFETKHDIKVEVDSDPTLDELQFIFKKLKEQGIEIKYKK